MGTPIVVIANYKNTIGFLGSEKIEYSADVVMILESNNIISDTKTQNEKLVNKEKLKLVFTKNRYFKANQEANLNYIKEFSCFEDADSI